MADPGLERLLASLGASFDAALARQEDEAAADLAFSLLQDAPFREAARRGAQILWGRHEVARPVAVVGGDYVGCGRPPDLFVPLRRAVLAAAEGSPPAAARDESLLELLRRWARAGVLLEVVTSAGRVRGRLRAATPDHLEIDARTRGYLVGVEAIESVRLLLEGSGDAL